MSSKTLAKELTNLKSQRAKILGDLDELSRDQEAKTEALGAAILRGSDGGDLESDLSKFDAKHRGLAAGLAQVDEQINKTQKELYRAEQNEARQEIHAAVQAIRKEMLAEVDYILALAEKQAKWENTLAACQDRAHNLGLNDFGDPVSKLKQAWIFTPIKQAANHFGVRRAFTNRTWRQVLDDPSLEIGFKE